MKTIVKKVGKKAVLADIPDDCKRLSALAEYLEADLGSIKISADTVVIYDKTATEDRHNVTLGGQEFYGDILLLGASGAWLKDVDLEIYTNRSLLPALWAKPKITNEKKEVDA